MSVAETADNADVVARPPLLYGAALLVVLALRSLWPLPIVAPNFARWPGVAVAVLSLAFGIWGRRTLVAAGTNLDPMRPTTAIVTSGPFRISRNPLYVALALLFLGLSLVFNTTWGLIALFPVLIVMHHGVIRREERYLQQKFGATYRTYCGRVRRYL